MLKKDFEKLDGSVNRVPDFPKPGILFYDVTRILKALSIALTAWLKSIQTKILMLFAV